MDIECVLKAQGYESCVCVIETSSGFKRPCKAGLMFIGNEVHRLIYDIVLSRPEDYSVYQSGCKIPTMAF